MEGVGEPVKHLTAEHIYNINADLIATFGGWYVSSPNLRYALGLDYILAVLRYPVCGIDTYPTVIDKAAGLAWYIITRHPFHNTNKRTAMEAAIEFLELNGFTTHFTPLDVIKTTIATQNGEVTYDEFRAWIASNVASNSVR